MSYHWPFKTAVALSALSVFALLPGCNGDNNSGGIAVPTATPTTQPAQTISAPIDLGNGKRGLLSLRLEGTRANGSLKVSGPTPAVRAAKNSADLLTFNIPTGAYGVNGTFGPPRNFSVTGTFPAPIGTFTITGVIATANEAGSFTVRAGGQTATGTIPALGPVPTQTAPGATPTGTAPTPTATSGNPTPTATSQPGATATPTPGGGSSSTNLTFTGASGYNGLSTPLTRVDQTLTASLVNQGTSGILNAGLQSGNATTGARTFTIQGFKDNGSIGVGTTLTVGATSGGTLTVRYGENRPANNNFVGTWAATGGTAQVTALTDTSITLRFNAVRFAPFSFGAANAQGNFTLNGPLTFPISRIG